MCCILHLCKRQILLSLLHPSLCRLSLQAVAGRNITSSLVDIVTFFRASQQRWNLVHPTLIAPSLSFGDLHRGSLPPRASLCTTARVVAHLFRKGQWIETFGLDTPKDAPFGETRKLQVSLSRVLKASINEFKLPSGIEGFAPVVSRTSLCRTTTKVAGQVTNFTVLPRDEGSLTTHFSRGQAGQKLLGKMIGLFCRVRGIHRHAQLLAQGSHL